jgi:hypothetical protein
MAVVDKGGVKLCHALPASDGHVDVARFIFQRIGGASRFLGGEKNGAGATELIEYGIAAGGAVEYRVSDKVCRLDCWMCGQSL